MILRVTIRALTVLSLGVVLFVATWLVLSSPTSSGVRAADPETTVIFVDGNNTPLTGTIRVLCYQAYTEDNPFTDREFTGVMSGLVDLPANCNYVAALHLKHEQPSGKPGHGPAYWVYETSWSPGDTMPLTATGVVTVSNPRPLVLFNVVASLAWRPTISNPYIAEMRQGLRQASGYLYDLTDGQMAFGPVAIHTGGHNWDGADLRFLAANDYRPSAYVGGIVPTRTVYTYSQYDPGTTHFKPGATFYGRYWDGVKASNSITGSWAYTNAYRTVIHEWAHYALFLYDEYQQKEGGAIYCICDQLEDVTPGGPPVCVDVSFSGFTSTLAASAMAFHYEDKASELWSKAVHGTPDACIKTHQWEYHRKSDWETLAAWHNMQKLPADVPSLIYSDTLNPGPELGLVGDLFGRMPLYPYQVYLPIIHTGGSSPPAAFEPILELSIQGSLKPTETLPTQVYVLKGSEQGARERILHQGKLISDPSLPGSLGSMKLLGIDVGDELRVFVDRYATDISAGELHISRHSISNQELIDGSIKVEAQDEDVDLQLSLNAKYEMTGPWVTTMAVTVTSDIPVLTPTIQLCAMDASIGCDPIWQKTMMPDPLSSNRIWTETFTPLAGSDELPLYGVVRVTDLEERERICWYQTAGSVPPAHDDSGAALRDGRVMVDEVITGTEPISGTPNQVMVMSACDHRALVAPLPSPPFTYPVQGIIDTPLDLDIIQSPISSPRCTSGNLSVPVRVTLFYNEDTIEHLRQTVPAFNETTDLRILHFNSNDLGQNFVWRIITSSGQNTVLNWLATEPVCEDGIYAIGWVGP